MSANDQSRRNLRIFNCLHLLSISAACSVLATVGSHAQQAPATVAQFGCPQGVAADASGNVYVADTLNDTIRKITPAGMVTTLAGRARNMGSADGVGSEAQFSSPRSLAVDANGNVYVADYFSNTIRKITPGGTVSTLAGSAARQGSVKSQGSADGPGSEARFNRPWGVAVDHGGNVYVADNFNHTIRKITPAGMVTTLAGRAGSPGAADGPASTAQFHGPMGVAVDASGNVYVAEADSFTIRKITPAGMVSTLAGHAGSVGIEDGSGSRSRFIKPVSVAVDGGGSVYVADEGNSSIRKITPAGFVSTMAGGRERILESADVLRQFEAAARARAAAQAKSKAPADEGFKQLSGVAVDASGNVYVADAGNSTIYKISGKFPNPPEVSTLAGGSRNYGFADGPARAAK